MTNDYDKFIREQYDKYDPGSKHRIVTNDLEFDTHYKKWDFFDYVETIKSIDGLDEKDIRLWTPGKIFLYEKYTIENKEEQLHYPKIGIYLNGIPCDQTIELEWVEWRRSWESNKKGETKNGSFYYLSSIVQSLPLWNDSMLIYGVWDKLPNWKELRKHYERTWWFHKTTEEKRDIKINSLIQ